VTTAVSTLPDSGKVTTPLEQWQQETGKAPAMWVADSEADLLAVESTDSGLTAGRDTEPIATSPVVLAVRSSDAAAAAALSWSDLAAQTGSEGTVTLPDGRRVILALPDPRTNRATSYALQSVLAAAAPDDETPIDTATVSAAAGDLTRLGAQDPTSRQTTTQDALGRLAAGGATFTAVPVVESDLTKFSASTPGLSAVSPQGGAVGDAVWPVPLTASWVTPTLKDAAARFAAFLRSPAGSAALSESGLRPTAAPAGSSASGTVPGTTAGSSTAGAPVTLPDAGAEVAGALATAIGG
jgi:ABC-type molybdate transport system substrate-binding protein